MNHRSPLLLLDAGYVSVYRFHACQKWYKLTHPNDTDARLETYDWSTNQEFVEKYRYLFFAGLAKTIRRFRVVNQNILFAIDDARDNIWRRSLSSSYKSSRRAKHQVGLSTILDMVRNELLPELVRHLGVSQLFVSRLEADDIIGIITRYVVRHKLFPEVIILTNDKDFVQLSHPRVSIVNLQGITIEAKNFDNPVHELIFHILCGDKSDCIGACFPNCNKQTAAKYVKDPLKLVQLLKTFPEIEEKFSINRRLIDLSQTPQSLQRIVVKKFMEIYHQTNDSSRANQRRNMRPAAPARNI